MITHEIFQAMDQCMEASLSGEESSWTTVSDFLQHKDWRVRYAAAIAAGDLRARVAVPALLALLSAEDKAPLFNQPALAGGGPAGSPFVVTTEFPEGTTTDQTEAWQRRGRIKQAVCLALGEIGDDAPSVLDALHRYAVDSSQDYMVRAASCHALGRIAHPSSHQILTAATEDEEFCTRLEANKALAVLSKKSRGI